MNFSEWVLRGDFLGKVTYWENSSAFCELREKETARKYARFFTVYNVSEYTAPRSTIALHLINMLSVG